MTKFVAFISGKGGTGKTTSAVNIGHALTKAGIKTLVLDANLVTPNIALHLGLIHPKNTLNQFLRKEKGLKEITYLHESGLSFIPASPSYSEFQKTNSHDVSKIFANLDDTADLVLVDAISGLGTEVSEVLKNCDEAVIVTNPNLSSVMDGLKSIELAKVHNVTIAGILLNKSNKGRHELKSHEIEEILGHQIIGNVPHHKKFRKASFKQAPLSYCYPYSKMAKEFRTVAAYLSLEEKAI